MSQPLYIPATQQEQVAKLRAMFEAPAQYDERLRCCSNDGLGLRITEVSLVPAWLQNVTAEMRLQQLEREHRRMQHEVCRGLKVTWALLAVLTIWALTLQILGIAIVLGVMCSTCLPLYLLASPTNVEVR